MRILGVDPGSLRCGYGVIELAGHRKVRYVECGVLEPSPRLPLPLRLAEIGDGLAEIIAELAPHALAVEGVFHGKNARSALQLGHARGVALYQAGRHALPVFEYAPATVKRAVAGAGAASKEQVSSMVRALCALKRVPKLDASDALAVAICHALRHGTRAALLATAKEAP